MTFLAAIVILSLSWQILGYLARRTVGFDPRNELSASLYVITALPAFAVGVYKLELERTNRLLKIIQICSMLAISDLIMSFIGIFRTIQFWEPMNQLMHGSTGYLTYGCLALTLSNKLSQNKNKMKILIALSKISYSVYLWHLPIFILCLEMFGSNFVGFFLALIITFAASYLSFTLFEKPFIKYSTQNVVFKVKGRQ